MKQSLRFPRVCSASDTGRQHVVIHGGGRSFSARAGEPLGLIHDDHPDNPEAPLEYQSRLIGSRRHRLRSR